MPTESGDAGAGPRARLPDVIRIESQTDGVRVHLQVPSDLAWFAGHFPGRPVLPGIAQVGWAIAFAREHFGYAQDPLGLDRIKFLETVPLEVPLVLELHRNTNSVDWMLTGDGRTCSSGRIRF